MLKRLLKIFGATAVILIGFIIVYLIAAFSLSRITVNGNSHSTEEVEIFILSNGVHTDLVVPIKTQIIDWSEYVQFENTISKDTSATYVALGWGDKGFYLETPTWADLKFSVAFKATFALSSSAMHATFYKELRENEQCKSIHISTSQYQVLVQYILNSFQLDSSNTSIHIKTNANYGKQDAFYEANGRYSLFFTCNTWVNNALKSCGQKTGFWTPFESGIFYHHPK